MERNGGITGPIPTEIGQSSTLAFFIINENQISNSIPIEMGNAKGLVDILMRDNLVR